MCLEPEDDDDLIVIGAGLMRTGTNSLKVALERLLRGKCYSMKDACAKSRHISLWIKANDEDYLSEKEWMTIFKGYCATVDYPGVQLYAELMRNYPNAKVILSIREPDSWIKSVRNSIVPCIKTVNSFPLNVLLYFTTRWQVGEMLTKTINIVDIDDDEKSVKRFNDWTEQVKATVPSDKLIIFEAKMGWAPLCKFLDVPVPNEPYPRVNSTSHMLTKMKWLKLLGYLFVFGVPTAMVLFGWLVYKAFYQLMEGLF